MPGAATIDLSAIPEAQREAVAAVLRERDALKEANKRLEHLVAELNHAVHGKRSEKLSGDDRQWAFEDLEIAVAEAEEKRDAQAPSERRSRRAARRIPIEVTRFLAAQLRLKADDLAGYANREETRHEHLAALSPAARACSRVARNRTGQTHAVHHRLADRRRHATSRPDRS